MRIFTSTNQRTDGVSPRRPLAGVLAMLVSASVLGAFYPAAASAAAAVNVAAAQTAAQVAVAASGHLQASGCTQTVGAADCDLYAMATTATVLGQPINIWGFSSTGTAGSATAPGPLLVVHEGDAVTLNLHNQVPGEEVSLALPGQTPSFAGGPGDDTTGVATGNSRTYSFTAGRPGTFLYEAGHTANGGRQVAMGLAGALVVLAADGSAYGSPATTYTDDAVVVLSEIDPALNAAPTTFDMRSFQPKYRLINGKPFPASDPISTDQGHTVLLRYVNVGSESHAMSLLGADQTQVALDGHPLAYAESLVIEAVKSGATADTLVIMPSGPEAKIALLDAAEHLDNNAQTTGDPLQFAFGGMLTFLDTAAPPPSTDGVGPVSSHVAVSPNPSDGLAPVTVSADVSDATTGGAAVSQAEFVIDDAVTTGVGFGTAMTGPVGPDGLSAVTGTISVAVLDALDAGKHTVFVRALDANGNWGVISSAILNLPKTGPQTTNGSADHVPANGASDVAVSATGDDSAARGIITEAEYFIDTLTADGTGTPLTLNRSATVVSEDAVIPAATVLALGEGAHHVYVHSKNSMGLWGPPLDITLPVDLTGPAVDAATVGPNPTNGVLSDKGNPGYLLVSAAITDKDADGAIQNAIVDAEAFLDPSVASPPVGTGLQLVAVDGNLDGTTESVYGLIPISQARSLSDGTHHVYVRGQDSAGNWGPLFAVDLHVDKTAPVLGTATASPSPTNGAGTLTMTAPVTDASLIAAAEFWIGTVDPGVGRGTPVPVSIVGGNVVASIPLGPVPGGTQLFNLRVQDLAGNWSKPTSKSVVVQKPNAIFSDNFDSGSLAAWSSSTGNVSSTASAGIPVGGTNKGLRVALPGGFANRLSFVTDASPAAEPAYHAQFSFNPNGLSAGGAAAVLTVFETRTAANGRVMALQYRRNGTTPQLRTVLNRSGAAALTGVWVNIPTGAHVVQLDWVAAVNGSVKLSVDNVARQTLSGNTNTLRVELALLGVSAGVVNQTSGTAFFDSFKSGRISIP